METALDLAFGDGTYRFHLPMQKICEIEKRCGDKSIVLMYEELSAGIGLANDTGTPRFLGAGSGRIGDVSEIIRCAAIGGGTVDRGHGDEDVGPLDAANLVKAYVDGRPFTETFPVAWAILNATIMGVDLKKKADAAGSLERTDAVR